MKHYREQSYYELLEVSPDASLDEITRAYRAAQEAFNPDSVAIYSLFDTDEEREALLDRIQDAYRILSNGRTRREYDRQLVRGPAPEDLEAEEAGLQPEIPFQWQPDPESERWAAQEPPLPQDLDGPVEPVRPAEGIRATGRLRPAEPDPADEYPEAEDFAEPTHPVRAPSPPPKPLPSLIRSQGVALEVEPGEAIHGSDLVRLRESRGVGLEELAQRIRVGEGTLRALEEDRHEGLPALIYVKGFLRAYAQVLKVDPKLLMEAYVLGKKAPE